MDGFKILGCKGLEPDSHGMAWHGSDGTNYRYRSLSGCTKQGAMTKVETARNTYTTVKWVCDKNQPIINARAVRSTPRVEQEDQMIIKRAIAL